MPVQGAGPPFLDVPPPVGPRVSPLYRPPSLGAPPPAHTLVYCARTARRAALAGRAAAARLHELELDAVLQMTTQRLLERRLQTKVFKQGLAKSIHHARVLIRQRHIRVGKQIVNIPSFMVRTESQKHIDFAVTSPYGGGRPGRNKRKAIAAKGGGGGGDGDEDME